MKKFAVVMMGAMLVGSLSFAADAENTATQTVDKDKNILTGSETTTVKSKKKIKGAKGAKAEATVTEKTKVHKDGQVEKSVDVEADSKSAETK